jgi:glucose/arabinose dehydrogenase
MNRSHSLLLASTMAVFGFAAGASAQGAGQIPPSTSPPAQDQTSPPQSQATPLPQQATRPGTTSDQLSQTRGVITPPPTGDHAVVTPPNIGAASTPVIPPPGTPGGNPEIQPK